jgi:flagellar protein FlbT
MHITLRPGEKLYLNGAVLRADRKVSLELMNDATFLLEAHIMNADKATTPVRQLYFIVQMMLMNPMDTGAARTLFGETVTRMQAAYTDRPVLDVLSQIGKLVDGERYFDALKLLRSVFDRDDELLAARRPSALALAS